MNYLNYYFKIFLPFLHSLHSLPLCIGLYRLHFFLYVHVRYVASCVFSWPNVHFVINYFCQSCSVELDVYRCKGLHSRVVYTCLYICHLIYFLLDMSFIYACAFIVFLVLTNCVFHISLFGFIMIVSFSSPSIMNILTTTFHVIYSTY